VTGEHVEELKKEELKTSAEWEKELTPNYEILDPDGWDRKNLQFSFYEEKITKNEFWKRFVVSTVMGRAVPVREIDPCPRDGENAWSYIPEYKAYFCMQCLRDGMYAHEVNSKVRGEK
jgi:hypothetical protein